MHGGLLTPQVSSAPQQRLATKAHAQVFRNSRPLSLTAMRALGAGPLAVAVAVAVTLAVAVAAGVFWSARAGRQAPPSRPAPHHSGDFISDMRGK